MQRRSFVQVSTGLATTAARLPTAALAAPVAAGGNSTPAAARSCEANKTVVRRFNKEVIEGGQRASFEALMDEAFVNRSAPAGAPGGPESMWNTFENVLRPALSGLKVDILDMLCDGDKVTTRKTIAGTHTGVLMGVAPTGRPVLIDVIDIVRVRDGRYVEHWGINTLAAVLAQLKAG